MFIGGSMKKILIFILLICILLMLPYLFCYPTKTAKKQYDLDNNETYILVKYAATTAGSWEILGDNEKMYESPIPAELKGNIPNVTFDVKWGDNTYVCYGEYNEDVVNLAGYKNKVFNVSNWDILYPIFHNHIWDWIIFSDHFLFSFEVE